MLVTAWKIPRPDLSASYLDWSGTAGPEPVGERQLALLGPCERELLVFGHQMPGPSLDVADVAAVAEVQECCGSSATATRSWTP